ncbi:hypothetical protein NPX13_g10516 [Xylaria arbuscula]|uniref:Uncharacterized protein n=1 Tax=Xylaria arbuscula TaxID=114810 RepID=A0A9W8THX6_9PEZI|nr:hypothetical protein NPX13_g10516 [Xylaria arbuscula]
MLSAKYHITYWTAAAGAVAVYRLLALHPLWITVCRLVIGPLAAYTTYASFMWDHHGKKKGRAGLYIHQAFVAWLLVALGSLMDYFQLPSEDVPKPLALLHVLSAFVAVGVLESVRQNRRDIEPANHLLIYCGPRTAFHYLPLRCLPAKLLSTLLCDAILFGIMPVAELVLREAGGMSLQPLVRYWFVEGMQRPGLLGSAVVAFYLGGPFADMAETLGNNEDVVTV